MLWRAIFWTLPGLGTAVGTLLLAVTSETNHGRLNLLGISLALILVSLVVPVLSMLANRGLLDRLAGTYLVPR